MSYFLEQFAECLDVARAYGAGKPVAKLAAEPACNLSLSTMKAALAGRMIRPASFLRLKRALGIEPLRWIECKIRYAEARMNAYLVELSAARVCEGINSVRPNMVVDAADDVRSPRQRLAHFFARLTPTRSPALRSLSDKVGRSRNRNVHTVGYSTLAALRRGSVLRSAKLLLLCRRLSLSQRDSSVARILHAETMLNERLLGSDGSVFMGVSSVELVQNFPRTAVLLIFSTENGFRLR